MPFSNNLQQILNNFANKIQGGLDSPAYAKVTAALNSSWTLLTQFEQAIAEGKITALDPLFNNPSGAGASFGNGKINIPVTIAGELASNASPAQFILVLGHEVQHSMVAADFTRGWKIFTEGVDDLAGRPGFQEYTQLLLASQNLHAIDEAEAQIAGWNAMIGYANSSGLNDGAQSIHKLGGSYSRFVMNPDGSPVSGLQFNSDLSISASASNISAVVMTYFMNPNSGFAFGLTYPPPLSK